MHDSNPTRLSVLLERYGIAAVVTALGVGASLLLAPHWSPHHLLLPFYPAVMLSAWFGGFGPGLLTTLLSALAMDYFWLPPAPGFGIREPGDLMGFLLFLAVGFLASSLNARLPRMQCGTEAAAAARRREAGLPHENLFVHLPRCSALLGGTTRWSDCVEALRYLLRPAQLVQGAKIEAYEQAFARTVGAKYAISFGSARVGLYGLLRAVGVGEGAEVLLAVPTHIVVANTIRYTGARPVYVDCRLQDYNIDLENAERRITSRSRVLVLQHTFGVPAEMDAVLAFARRHNLVVFEDCVHALGARYDGRQVGTFGDGAIFSTEETKTISTTMGGMAVTNDPNLASRMRNFQASCSWPRRWLVVRYLVKFVLYYMLTEPHVHRFARVAYERLGRRNPLPMPTSLVELKGQRPRDYERRLSNGQAALGLCQLSNLEKNLEHRELVANGYRARLSGSGLRLPQAPAKAEPSFVRYPVWVDDRPSVIRALVPHAVIGTWFTSVLEEAESPAVAGYEPGSCPRAEEVAQHLINLPTHPRVSERDVRTLAAALMKAVSSEKIA
jgi:perosamine synthetase